jgi:dihydropteroate synthase
LTEEANRVLPVIKRLVREIDIPVSIDTTKAEIAREALAAGAEIISDISSMSFDEHMMQTVIDSGAAVVLMHMRGKPKNMQKGDLTYRSVRGEVIQFLRERMNRRFHPASRQSGFLSIPGSGSGKRLRIRLNSSNTCRSLNHWDDRFS